MNPMEFTMTRRMSWPCGDFNSSTPAPEISETYPGTSGSTHGDRKEINPATKAAMGSGRLDIGPYCKWGALRLQNKDARKTIKLHFFIRLQFFGSQWALEGLAASGAAGDGI